MKRLLATIITGMFSSAIIADPLVLPELPPPEIKIIQPKVLTLKKAMLLSLDHNNDIRVAELNRVSQKFLLVVARKEFEPNYKLSSSATYQNNTTPKYNINPQIGIKTPFGTQIDLDYGKNFVGDETHSVTLTAKQPLLKGFGPEVVLANLRNSYDNEKVNRLGFKDTITKSVQKVIQQYRKVIADQNKLKVGERGLEAEKSNLKKVRLLVKHGRKPEHDLIAQEAQVANRKLTVIQQENSYRNDMKDFLALLNLDPESHIKLDDKIELYKAKIPNREEALKIALKNNTKYQQDLIKFRQDKRSLMLAKDNNRWDLNVEASASLDRSGNQSRYEEPEVKLNLSIPIDDVKLQQGLTDARIRIEQDKIQLAQERRDVQKEVLKEINDLELSKQQIIIGEQSVSLSTKTYQGTLIRYRHGLVTIFEVTSRENDLLDKEIELINDKIEYLNSIDSFYVNLGTAVDRWGIEIQY